MTGAPSMGQATVQSGPVMLSLVDQFQNAALAAANTPVTLVGTVGGASAGTQFFASWQRAVRRLRSSRFPFPKDKGSLSSVLRRRLPRLW